MEKTKWADAGRQALQDRGIDPRSVQLVRTVRSPAGVHLDYQQVHNRLPVFGAGATVHLSPEGQVTAVDADIHRDIPPDSALTQPAIGAEQAERTAVANLGGIEVLRGDPTAELGIQPLPGGRYALVWRVLCPAYEPAGDWLFQVDAQSGAVISRENIMVEVRTRVFAPNPIVTSGNPRLYHQVAAENQYEPLLEQARTVELHGLVADQQGAVLAGERVRIVDANPPQVPVLVTDPLPAELLFSPETPEFAATMAYFWLDTVLRYLHRQGFSDLLTAGVEADPLDGTARGGAFYSPWSKRLGFAPRGERRPAMAEDAKVILHELGHAIQHDQVRGWGGHPEMRAMGEGFGDALAAIYFAHVNEGFQAAVVGDWVRPPEGIRRVDRDLRYPDDLTGDHIMMARSGPGRYGTSIACSAETAAGWKRS